MKVKWNNCFFCLNKLPNKTSDDLPVNIKVKRLKLILNYLIGGEQEEKLNIKEKVTELWSTSDSDLTKPVELCDNCNDTLNRFVKLHMELDVIQMKIVEIIKEVRKVIIQNSKYCEDGEDKDISDWLTSQREGGDNKNNSLAEKDLNNGRRILETLESFQGAIFKTGNSAIKKIPCIYLESSFITSLPIPSSPSLYQADDQLVLKIEPECPLTPLNPDTFDENDNFDEMEPMPLMPPSNLDLLKLEPDLSDDRIKPKKLKVLKQKRISSHKTRESTKLTMLRKIPPPQKPKTPKKKVEKVCSAVPKKGRRKKKKTRSCDNCPFSTTSIYKFEFHLRKHEEVDTHKPFSCALCDLPISTKQYRDFHIASHQGRQKVQCDLCMEKVDLILLTQHMKGHQHEDKKDPEDEAPLKLFPCPNCSYCSSLREKYLDHLRDHHDKYGQFFCDICGFKVASRPKLLIHLYNEHNAIQKLTCDFEDCKMEYLDSFLLWNHQKKHKKQWICEFCGMACTSLSGLKVHERNHTGERPFPCDQCSETFKMKADLSRHLINTHDGERSQCQICDKQYKDPVSFQNHMRIHNGGMLPCDQCGQAFVSKHLLRRHMIVHSTQRNFICEECGKAFRTKNTLKTHVLTHTGAFNFKCTYCSNAFRRKQYLVAHLRTHTGERPFICDICGSSFTQAGSLNYHKKKRL